MGFRIGINMGMTGGGGASFDAYTAPGLVSMLKSATPNLNPATVYATDSFTRANSTNVVGSTETGSQTWVTDLGTMGINTNKAYASATGTNSRAVSSFDIATMDVLLEVDVTIENNLYNGVALRVADGANYLCVGLSNFGTRVSKVIAGTNTNIGSLSASGLKTIGNTHRLRVSLVGQAISVAIDGVFEGVYTLSAGEITAFTGTKHGIMVNSTTARLNDFSAESISNKPGLGMYAWDDLAGQGWSYTQPTGLYRPILTTVSSLQVARNVASGSMSASHPALSTGEVTIICIGKNTSNPTDPQRVVSLGLVGGTGTNSLQFINGQLTPEDGALYYTGIPIPTVDEIFGLVGSTSGFPGLGSGVKTFGHNGCMVFRHGSAVGSDGTWANRSQTSSTIFNRGAASGTDDMLGDLRLVLIYNRALTDSELSKAIAQLATEYSVPADTPATYNIVFEGDSLTTSSLGSGTTLGSYPDRVVTGLTGTYRAWNVAVHGQNLTSMIADAATQVDPLYNSSISKNICIVWGGTNDMTSVPSNPTAAFNNLKSYCNSRRTAGWKVIVLTCLPRSAVAQFETDRQAFNTSIRGDTSFYDALADVGADATIGAAGAQNNTTYYQGDKAHLTSAGYGVVAPIVSTALLTL